MNSCDYRIFWEETVKQLKDEVGEQEISTWFSRIVYERASDTTIVLSVPSGFYRDRVRQRYELLIEKKEKSSPNRLKACETTNTITIDLGAPTNQLKSSTPLFHE